MPKSIRAYVPAFTFVVALFALLLPQWAMAAGLGRLTLNSALGQPLNAEIELVAVDKDEIGGLVVRLASPDAFQQANIDYAAILSSIKFKVETRPDGQPYIKVTSTEPVNDPFVSMLVELNWSSGRLLREYTFLLDPSEIEAAKPTAPAVRVAPVAPEKPRAAEQKPVAPAPAEAAVAVPAAAGATYGPVKRGDTLSKIARGAVPEGVNLDQMLVALYRANRDAFVGNMNRLKTGPILRIPEPTELATVDAQEAHREVRVQAANWNAYRQKLAGAVGAAPAAEAPKQTVAGKITTTVEEKAPAAKESGKEVLKLSKGEAPAGKDVKSLQAKVRAMEEEKIAREKALKEANERVALLEKNIQEMRRLLELKSPGMAQAQKQAEAKPGVTSPASAPTAPAPKAAAPAAKPPEGKPGQPKQPAKPKAATPPPPPAPSVMDMLMDNLLYVGAAIAVLILGAAGLVFARKKTQAAERFEPGGAVIMPAAAAGAEATPAFGKAEGVHAEEVDALEEAKVYLDYGRDAQAEEILKEALAKNPNRPEVMGKLLEVYALRKDKKAFESMALQLQAAVGGAGPLWDHAISMGHSIDPANPLYGGAKEEVPLESTGAMPVPDIVLDTMVASPGKLDFDIGMGAGTAAQAVPEQEVKAETASGLDFDLGRPGPETGIKEPAPVAVPESPDQGLAFDITAPSAPATEGPAAAPEAAPDLGISFSLEMPEEAKPAAEAESAPAPGMGLGDISFSFDETPAAAEPAAAEHDSHWQDVATKLDLAKAYQEMGDKDGAKEILDEVLREGDAKQQEDARALLASLA